MIEKVVPETVLVEYFCVSEDDHAIFCSGYCHVQPTRIFEETYAWTFVGSHTRDYYVVLLTALVTINRGYLNFFVVIRVFGGDLSVLLEIVDDVSPLALIRSDDSNLLGLDSCPLQVKDYLIDSRCFSPVQIRGSRC